MNKNKDYHIIRKMVVGELRNTIKLHGPITSRLIGSAAKRIAGVLASWHKKTSPKEKVGSYH